MTLSVRNLRLWLRSPETGVPVEVLRGVSFELGEGGSLGIVGESGSGKTMSGLSLIGLLPEGARREGEIILGDRDIIGLRGDDIRAVRGKSIAMIFQDPATALNPLIRVGEQIAESLRTHEGKGQAEAARGAVEWLGRVGIDDPSGTAQKYPHQLSGGMRQRAIIAMALCCGPRVLVADEPTTALDVSLQRQVLDLIGEVRRSSNTALILVSHDLALVSNEVERIAIMYAGRVVEAGPTAEVVAGALHPYTRMLLKAVPAWKRGEPLESVPGAPPDFAALPAGCSFRPRCPLASDKCRQEPVPEQRGPRMVECWNV